MVPLDPRIMCMILYFSSVIKAKNKEKFLELLHTTPQSPQLAWKSLEVWQLQHPEDTLIHGDSDPSTTMFFENLSVPELKVHYFTNVLKCYKGFPNYGLSYSASFDKISEVASYSSSQEFDIFLNKISLYSSTSLRSCSLLFR